ncbi:unnamed protein product [Tetraodon nigroviridis]|uniref:(spotted green pufferfish) hypothetical protein n=1 Tax=Tetraodon nigroviridis TaxID=99883 RepID=Q4SQ27_TETNG|nr:unnamed protein product [Tetraodon nigroviridis]
MKIAVLLVLLSVGERSSSREVVGYVGQNVTLSCTYDTKDGQLHACWGRGPVPMSGCRQQLISSDGCRIKEGSRVSSRYQLLGRLDEGDVSLTILGITADDAGTYGCRVEIVGWFNDKKHHINLVVKEAAASTTSTTTLGETVTVSVSTRAVQLTSTNTLVTSSLGPLEAEVNGTMTVVLVFVIFGCIVTTAALVAAVGLLIITKKWGQLSKIPADLHKHTGDFLFGTSQGRGKRHHDCGSGVCHLRVHSFSHRSWTPHYHQKMGPTQQNLSVAAGHHFDAVQFSLVLFGTPSKSTPQNRKHL